MLLTFLVLFPELYLKHQKFAYFANKWNRLPTTVTHPCFSKSKGYFAYSGLQNYFLTNGIKEWTISVRNEKHAFTCFVNIKIKIGVNAKLSINIKFLPFQSFLKIFVSSVLKVPENSKDCFDQNQWFFWLKVDGNKIWHSVLVY